LPIFHEVIFKNPLEFILIYGVKERAKFLSFQTANQMSQHHLLNNLPLPTDATFRKLRPVVTMVMGRHDTFVHTGGGWSLARFSAVLLLIFPSLIQTHLNVVS
jgi:hypothetical protein